MSPPKEVRAILKEARDKDEGIEKKRSAIRRYMRKLYTSKFAWYTAILLAMAAVGWPFVREYMKTQHIDGMGESSVKTLEKLSSAIPVSDVAITNVRATTNRKAYLDEKKAYYLKRLKNKKISLKNAYAGFSKEFGEMNSNNTRTQFLKNFTKSADAIGGYPSWRSWLL